MRDRPRHATPFGRVRRALRAGARRRRFQGLSGQGAALDSSALVRRPSSRLRRGHHDHRVAQPAVGQRFQVLRTLGRPGRSARRSRDHRVRQGGLRSARYPRCRSRRRLPSGSVVEVLDELDSAYLTAVLSESVSHARDLSVVYTPLHGVGESSVARVLKMAGFRDVSILASQRSPDPDFTNVPDHVANPEYPRTLAAAIAEARKTGADLVVASDPDADRIGVGVPVTRDPHGEWTTLDGNQIGVLLAAFVMKECQARGKLRPDHYLITTLVSTQMARAVARREGVRVEDDLLVGFKWIGKRDRRGRPSRVSVRVRGVARLLEGDARPRQGCGRRGPALRRTGRHRQGPEADRPRIPRRPFHRRRPSWRSPRQQGARRPRRGGQNQPTDARVPRAALPAGSLASP